MMIVDVRDSCKIWMKSAVSKFLSKALGLTDLNFKIADLGLYADISLLNYWMNGVSFPDL